MSSETNQKISQNNCAHEQLFKASGLVEANIATTVTKDNICASGKEGIKGNDQTDNRTSLCKPEDLFLALAHIENKLARAWLHKFDEGKKILIDPIATLSEHHVSDNDKGYATLDCFIFMDSFGAQNLATNGTQIPYCNAAQDDDWSYNQPVDGDEKVFMCLVDYDLADGQLAHAAGGTPSKPHEWMVSNLLSPYSSTLAMHAQSDSGGCGKLIVSGFINAEDNKATEQKTEQTAPASSPGLVHHPKMEAFTLLSVFESPTDSNSGPRWTYCRQRSCCQDPGFRD